MDNAYDLPHLIQRQVCWALSRLLNRGTASSNRVFTQQQTPRVKLSATCVHLSDLPWVPMYNEALCSAEVL